MNRTAIALSCVVVATDRPSPNTINVTTGELIKIVSRLTIRSANPSKASNPLLRILSPHSDAKTARVVNSSALRAG
ncbi:unnamed protein product [Periconia digitata]|uniref:Uncharacterized protein n=1 Tax=Periconia digitata TaxID=1303443 RepID=A0A9W4U3Y9_9PLEO|nr:unnamed protein product [Periconia digitata]